MRTDEAREHGPGDVPAVPLRPHGSRGRGHEVDCGGGKAGGSRSTGCQSWAVTKARANGYLNSGKLAANDGVRNGVQLHGSFSSVKMADFLEYCRFCIDYFIGGSNMTPETTPSKVFKIPQTRSEPLAGWVDGWVDGSLWSKKAFGGYPPTPHLHDLYQNCPVSMRLCPR